MKTFRVATLNIWNRFGPWEQRLAAIRAGMTALAPDIIGLQEVVRLDAGEGDALDQSAAIGDGLGYHSAYSRARDERYYGNAVLSRWPIARRRVYELPRCGTEERRTLLFAEITSPFGAIPFFVTHLNWKFDDGHVRDGPDPRDRPARRGARQGRRLPGDRGRRLQRRAGCRRDALHAWPDHPGRPGGGRSVYFQDAFAIAGDGSPGFTYARSNPFAAPLREPDRRIDYVFVRGRDDRFRGEPLAASVCFDQAVDGAFPSDHFGVIATLRGE